MLAKPLRKEFDEPQIEQIYKVIKELPAINIELKLKGPLKDVVEVDRIVPVQQGRDAWLEVHANEEYTLIVNLQRLGVKTSDHIYCRFPKPKDEGWLLTLGCQESGELLALKRVAYRNNRSSQPLIFKAPSRAGRVIYTVYFLSDGQIGLDQQFNIQLEVLAARNLQKLPVFNSMFTSDEFYYKDKL